MFKNLISTYFTYFHIYKTRVQQNQIQLEETDLFVRLFVCLFVFGFLGAIWGFDDAAYQKILFAA